MDSILYKDTCYDIKEPWVGYEINPYHVFICACILVLWVITKNILAGVIFFIVLVAPFVYTYLQRERILKEGTAVPCPPENFDFESQMEDIERCQDQKYGMQCPDYIRTCGRNDRACKKKFSACLDKVDLKECWRDRINYYKKVE
jgi:hypothetical protein